MPDELGVVAEHVLRGGVIGVVIAVDPEDNDGEFIVASAISCSSAYYCGGAPPPPPARPRLRSGRLLAATATFTQPLLDLDPITLNHRIGEHLSATLDATSRACRRSRRRSPARSTCLPDVADPGITQGCSASESASLRIEHRRLQRDENSGFHFFLCDGAPPPSPVVARSRSRRFVNLRGQIRGDSKTPLSQRRGRK